MMRMMVMMMILLLYKDENDYVTEAIEYFFRILFGSQPLSVNENIFRWNRLPGGGGGFQWEFFMKLNICLDVTEACFNATIKY